MVSTEMGELHQSGKPNIRLSSCAREYRFYGLLPKVWVLGSATKGPSLGLAVSNPASGPDSFWRSPIKGVYTIVIEAPQSVNEFFSRLAVVNPILRYSSLAFFMVNPMGKANDEYVPNIL